MIDLMHKQSFISQSYSFLLIDTFGCNNFEEDKAKLHLFGTITQRKEHENSVVALKLIFMSLHNCYLP